ncbi:hypothetical protein QQX98_003205 [Neonectria punicea]|uniref:NACHT domain-containing protein n=1 Tax=Neonectria punicea TaxID=979145 RepID=A0ABR1HFK2_9HYPO
MRRLRDKLSSKLHLNRPASPAGSASSSGKPAEAPTKPSPAPSGRSATVECRPERLWNRAYDALKVSEKDSSIVEAYERILSSQLQEADGTEENTTNIISPDPAKRCKQMERLVQAGLDKTKKDAMRKETVQKGIDLFQPVKKAIDTGVKAAPEAALAWAAVNCALEILSNPLSEPGKNRDGMTYVVSRMEWYWDLTTLLLDENRADASSLPLRDRLEEHIIDLYQMLLLYEMKSVCLYHRSRLAVFFRDLPKLDDWESQLKDIKDAEAAVVSESSEYNTLEIRNQLQNAAVSAAAQAASLQSIRSATQDQTTFQRTARRDDKDTKCLRDLYATDPRDDKTRIEETKGGLIWDSYRWILDHADYQQWLEDDDSRLLWVKGDPGKGKTMLLCGIINDLETSQLGFVSYFFCQATVERLRTATGVVRGLIYSLVRGRPSLISHIRERYDHAGASMFTNQNAWQALRDILTNMLRDEDAEGCVFVVDALDECTSGREQLIDLICHLSSEYSTKWIVSSRNWPEIEEQLEGAAKKVRLHLELNHAAISNAVQHYISYKIDQLAKQKNYSNETRQTVHEHLKANADDTFLWVALVCQGLKKREVRPHQTLRVLQSFPAGLDELYQRMMKDIEHSLDVDICRTILAVIAAAVEPLVLPELAACHETLNEFVTKLKTLEEIVHNCGSFLTIREGLVDVVHQSAKDYLLGTASAVIMPLGIEQQHRYMLASSLGMMQKILHRDMYGLDDDCVCIDDIQAPEPNPLSCIWYCCIYWVHHFCQSQSKENDATTVTSVTDFIKQKYLYWLEAMSLLGQVSAAVTAIRELDSLLNTGAQDATNVSVIHDALRFILAYRYTVDTFPLQLYSSALLFSPLKSEVRSLFWREAPASIEILYTSFEDWDVCLQTIDDADARQNTLSFSPDGQRLATMHRDCQTIQILDVSTGDSLYSLKGHDEKVNSISFHPDGKHLASMDRHGVVMIWDTSNGDSIHSFQVYGSFIASFSPDGEVLATASSGDIAVWDPWTGVCLQRMLTNVSTVNSWPIPMPWICWGPAVHTRRILSLDLHERQFEVWDPTIGERSGTIPIPENIVKYKRWCNAALSPDGRRLAFATSQNVWICDWQTSLLWQRVEGLDFGTIWTLAWAPDTELLALAMDRGIVVWDLGKAAAVAQLQDHLGSSKAVCFGKGNQLASSPLSFRGSSLKIWGAMENWSRPMTENTPEPIDRVYMGPCNQLAAQTYAGNLKLVDVVTGHHVQTLCHANLGRIRHVAFGPDHQLATESLSGLVAVWDTVTGTCLQTFQFDTEQSSNVAFGPPGLIAAAHKGIKIWEISTGVCLREFGVHHDSTSTLVAFAQNGRVANTLQGLDEIEIWDGLSGTWERTIPTPSENSESLVELSAGSNDILAGCTYNYIKVWNMENGSLIQWIDAHCLQYSSVFEFEPGSSSRLSIGSRVLDLEQQPEFISEAVAAVWDRRSMVIDDIRYRKWFMKAGKRTMLMPEGISIRKAVVNPSTDNQAVSFVDNTRLVVFRFR